MSFFTPPQEQRQTTRLDPERSIKDMINNGTEVNKFKRYK